MFLSSWSDRQILLCPPCERGGGGDRKCAEDTLWLQRGNDGTLCGCSRGRAKAKWRYRLLLQWARERATLMTRRKKDGEVCVRATPLMWMWHHTRHCNEVFLALQSNHLNGLQFPSHMHASFNTSGHSELERLPFFLSHTHRVVGFIMVLKCT